MQAGRFDSRARWGSGFFALWGVLITPTLADAHLVPQKRIEVEIAESRVRLLVRLPALDTAAKLGLGTNPSASEWATAAEPLNTWITRTLAVGTEKARCPRSSKTEPSVDSSRPDDLQITVAFDCSALAGNLALVDESLAEPGHETVVLIRGPRGSEFRTLRTDRDRAVLVPTESSRAVAGRYLAEGAIHLAVGYDHVLFLVALLLCAGMLCRNRGSKVALRSTWVLVTAFTIGHSLTLAPTALGWITVPAAPVEAAIALSVVLVGLMNVLFPESAAARPWIAGIFGLIHGFGFSAVLGEFGLPPADRVLALVFFNLGIEVAQLVFVAALWMPLAWIARRRWYPLVAMRLGSGAVAFVGLVWLVQRTSQI